MHDKDAAYGSLARTLRLLWALMLAACGNGMGADAGANNVDSAPGGGDASVPTGANDSGTGTGNGDVQGGSDALNVQNANGEGGSVQTDGGAGTTEGGAPTDGGVQGDGAGAESGSGSRDIGSCCSQQSTPGCGDPNLEVCVCQKDPSCCTMAWGPGCVLIVQQKYCQPGVRDCVCGSDAGQWGQTQCCTMDWTSTCDSVATVKCNAVQGCF
jgi:hypothetical protein